MATPALAALLLLLQAPPDERQKSLAQEAGVGFNCRRLLPNLYLATNLADPEEARLRGSFQDLHAAIGDFAFAPLLRAPLSVIAFRDRESLEEYALRHPDERLRAPGSYDPLRRRLLGLSTLIQDFAPTILAGLSLKDFLRNESPPAWLLSGLTLLPEISKKAEADSRIALLKNEWLRDKSPTLSSLLRMNLEAFQKDERQSLHLSLSREWLNYLSKRGLLKTFMTDFRQSMAADPTGVRALEKGLGTSVEKIEGEWEGYLRSLSWLDEKRFLKKVRELFGDGAVVRFDDELILAVAGNAEEKTILDCLGEARKVRRPLLKALGLRPSYLPLRAYIFKDQASLGAHVQATSTDQKEVGLGGLYMPKERTLLLNAGSGPRAFVHELAHSWIIDEAGDLPPWVAEGLAALYEAYELGPGGIRPLRGQALRDIQAAKDGGKLPRFEDFLNPAWKGFWESDRIRLSYSMSRGLMMYLEETGRLAEFVKNLMRLVRTAPELDPTCSKTLEKSAGVRLEDLYRNFQAWAAENARKP